MIKFTHVFHFGQGTYCAKVWPDGVPVFMTLDDDHDTEWFADYEYNVCGHAHPNGYRNEHGSYVVEIKD